MYSRTRTDRRCGVPVFLRLSRDDMANVLCLFEYVAYAFATKKKCGRRPSQVVCRRSNTFTVFRVVSSSTLPSPLPLAPSQALLVRTPTWETKQPCVGPFHGGMSLAGEALIPSWRGGGRVLWLTLRSSFCFLTRALETFAETRLRIHESHCFETSAPDERV